MFADHLLEPWLTPLRDHVGADLSFFDAHTHCGANDPSGFSLQAAELRDALQLVRSRAAVFPLTEPDGYREANEAMLAAAAASDGALVAFCRIRPGDDEAAQARDHIRDGAKGIKLHPSSDQFTINDARLAPGFELADEQRLPVILHAGPECEPLGEQLTSLLHRYSGMRLILAHAGLTDLAWLNRSAGDYPNLYFDTSWWSPTDLINLFAHVPPGQVLYGSDAPYSTPLWGAHAMLRCALYAGLDAAQIASVAGGQFDRLVERAEPKDFGPALGGMAALDPLLERAYIYLCSAVEPVKRGESPEQTLSLVRRSCAVPTDHPNSAVFESVLQLLQLYDDHVDELATSSPYAAGWDLVSAAAVIARTPGPPLPR